MPGEAVGNNQNQGMETNNGTTDAWERMADEMQQKAQEVEVVGAEIVDGDGRVLTETKAEIGSPEVRGTAQQYDEQPRERSAGIAPQVVEVVGAAGQERGGEQVETEQSESAAEQYWQGLADEMREKGVEIGEMPDMKQVDRAIANFFENGINGVTGKAREVREGMAQKAVLKDLAKLKERGGELNDETMRNVFYGTQRMLEEMYRGNRKLREDAKGEKLSPDEEIAWRLKMDPQKAKMNVLLVMQQHVRRAGETDEAYETRLRNYAEDTIAHQRQLEEDKTYDVSHPAEAAEYAAQVLTNGQKDDLPEFTYLKWEGSEETSGGAAKAETEKPKDREGRIGQLFERMKEKIGFQKVMEKLMGKFTEALAWADEVLASENEENSVTSGGAEQVEKVETERQKKIRELNEAKTEAERRMANSQGNGEMMLKWAQTVVKLNVRIAELEAEEASERAAA